jgi:hypothetical protein
MRSSIGSADLPRNGVLEIVSREQRNNLKRDDPLGSSDKVGSG